LRAFNIHINTEDDWHAAWAEYGNEVLAVLNRQRQGDPTAEDVEPLTEAPAATRQP